MINLGKMENLPMPPSINSCYTQAGKRRVSSLALQSFKTAAMKWALVHKNDLRIVRQKIPAEQCGYRLRFQFYFPPEKLFILRRDKNGPSTTPKKLDVSNRIKPAEDIVCQFLGFDDRWVWGIEAEKSQSVKGLAEFFDVSIYAYIKGEAPLLYTM